MLAALPAQAQPADAQQNPRPPGGVQTTAPARAAPSLAPVLKKITPAVVSIETKFRAQDAKNRRRDARDLPGNVGSGVVFDAKRGLIITNNHVIDRADDITVTPSRLNCSGLVFFFRDDQDRSCWLPYKRHRTVSPKR